MSHIHILINTIVVKSLIAKALTNCCVKKAILGFQASFLTETQELKHGYSCVKMHTLNLQHRLAAWFK